VNNDETSLVANAFGKVRVQPALIIDGLDCEYVQGKNKDGNEGESCGVSFLSKYHLSLGHRRGSWPVSLNGIVLIFSDSPFDGKPIREGWLRQWKMT
jgi:hypothetical protein